MSPNRLFAGIYASTAAYAVATYALGELIAFGTLVTMGVPSLLFGLALLAAPTTAYLAGVQSQSSRSFALLVGYPSAILLSVISPVVSASKYMGAPVPWLAIYSAEGSLALAKAMPLMKLGAAVSTIVFGLAFVRGRRLRRKAIEDALSAPLLRDIVSSTKAKPN